MAEQVDQRVRLDPDRRLDLELLAEDTGWSMNKIVNRAIKEMLVLHYIRHVQAAQAGGIHGELLIRVTHEFGAAMLISRTLGYGHDEKTGDPLISAEDKASGEKSVFYVDENDRLFVQRTLNDVVQHFLVKDGELQLVDVYPATGNPILN